MHEESGVRQVMMKENPLDPNHLGVDIAIDEWGPAAIERIAKIRSKLNAKD